MKKERQPSYRWDFKNKKEVIHKWMDQQNNTSQSLQVLVMNFIDRYGYVDVTDYDVQKHVILDTERLKTLGKDFDKNMLNQHPKPNRELPMEDIKIESSEENQTQKKQKSKTSSSRNTLNIDYSKVNKDFI